jgi:hypothetical protein
LLFALDGKRKRAHHFYGRIEWWARREFAFAHLKNSRAQLVITGLDPMIHLPRKNSL